MKYKDKTFPVADRVQDLLQRMTLTEKIGQMVQPFGWQCYEKQPDGTTLMTESFKRQVARGGVGSLYGTLRADPWTGVTLESGLSPREGAEAVNEIQAYAMKESRLGIPILFGEECSHGHMAIGATVFPVPLALGSMWNPDLYREMCRAVAVETRSQGGAATYSPVLDVVRDPRWGRTEETFGEDPFLIAAMGVEAVKGLQGERLDAEDAVLATLKHFAAYGSSEGGRNSAPVHMGLRELHEVDLLPFRKAVEAGARSLMTAYNEIDGVPCTTSHYLLQNVLREQWGFDGFVITDCGALGMLTNGHNTADSGEAAVAQALLAGIDMEMSGEMLEQHLGAAIAAGRLHESDLDRGVSRILEMKFTLGLFDRPFADPDRAEQLIGSAEHRKLARRIAGESIIMLKNEAATLPLSPNIGRVAVIGPNADNPYNQLGDYTSPQPKGAIVTVLEGIRSALGGDPDRVLYAPGCRIKGDSREGFAYALECAAQADVVVLAIGGSSARDFGEGTIDLLTGASVVTEHAWSDMECGEGIDRSTLHLMGVQLELVQELHKLGKPLVIVYINGRPIAEPWIVQHADAILEAWYPGQEGGHAIADILFGEVNPSGRLTISIPKHVGQLPVYYYKRRTRGKRYLETDFHAEYPFGFGLGFSEFKYSHLQVEPAIIGADGEALVSVQVSNLGARAGAEVVQLYISDLASTITRPEKSLKGFRKITLQPGETQTVTFSVGREQLEFVSADLSRVVEDGDFTVMVGPHSGEYLSAPLRVESGVDEA
ncbi:glycoside hydrolase family 3 N-terminal domain-containing protein [Paenibacillus donghaensis]|uniref:Beta-glucosidase n=1 Tax=Paenibacillus donghaensis TaxID=414771 RepID=A0A2Z2KLA7_9BACL|nr:glycoside hydrolase family 3 N-terminal domain-containing protein [Paenibacillus donghaensis]ASA24210.1 beta-glucosidase [Paenibacillus donghaensis]